MSWGRVVCSICNRDVHQDGPRDTHGVASWRHHPDLDHYDLSPMCATARATYPREPEREPEKVGPEEPKRGRTRMRARHATAQRKARRRQQRASRKVNR